MLLLMADAGADLGCRTFVVANEKFIRVFVTAFRKSDAPGHHNAEWRIVMQQRVPFIATQLNSTGRPVELSCIAINGG